MQGIQGCQGEVEEGEGGKKSEQQGWGVRSFAANSEIRGMMNVNKEEEEEE